MSETFAPWKQDFRHAYLLWLVGLIWLTAAVLWNIFFGYAVFPIALSFVSVIPLYYGFQYFESGRRRRHGIVVEKEAIADLQDRLPDDWDLYIDWSLGERDGNIDMVVRFDDGDRSTIDVKSWHSWQRKGNWVRSKAIRQVHRQRRKMSIRNGIVWLPRAAVHHISFERGIWIIEGKTDYLITELRTLMRQDVIVRFPHMPSEHLRILLKRKYEFLWDKKNYHWAGRCSKNQIASMRPQIEKENGILIVATKTM